MGDTDGDGIPNVWERLNGLFENDPGDADADTDGDGMNNRMEYIVDTDPLSSASKLQVSSFAGQGTGILLNWRGGQSVTQYIELAPTPGGPWLAVFTNYPPMATSGATTVNVEGVNCGFFRVKVQP